MADDSMDDFMIIGGVSFLYLENQIICNLRYMHVHVVFANVRVISKENFKTDLLPY